MGPSAERSRAAALSGSREARFIAVALGLVALDGMTLQTAPLPNLVWLGSAIMLFCILADIAAITILLAGLRTRFYPSTIVITGILGASVLIATTLMLTVPYSGGQPALVEVDPPTNFWLHAFWHLLIIAGAFGYVAVRRNEPRRSDPQPPVNTPTPWIIGAGLVIGAGLAIVACFTQVQRLPHLDVVNSATRLRASGFGYVLIAISIAATFAITRLPRMKSLDRAMALALFAVTLDVVVTVFNAQRFTASYYIARALGGGAMFFVLIAAVNRLLRAYHDLPDVEAALTQTQHIGTRQATRLAAVWRIMKDTAINDMERLQAILNVGTESIRPGRPFYGKLSHQEGDELVVDLVSSHLEELGEVLPPLWTPGDRATYETTFSAGLFVGHQSASYNSSEEFAAVTGRPAEDSRGLQSALRARFTVGTVAYFITFASTDSLTDDPFTEDDLAFGDVLGSFIGTHLLQSRQLAQIRYQIEHDLLTALPNRSSFRSAAREPIASKRPFAIAIFDLDRFREVNESFGHMTADALLVEIAAGLSGALAAGDVVARMHGDKFGVLLDGACNSADVDERLAPYRAVFASRQRTGDRTGTETLAVSASVGVVLFPQDAATFDELLARADAAVDFAKRRARGSITYFNADLETLLERRRIMHAELGYAVAGGQLGVLYQPTIELATGRIVGAEALVRWEHPTRGTVEPDDFIPFAEENGLIHGIGRWVMRRVIDDINEIESIPRDFKCFVNLSGHQLGDSHFVAEMRDHLAIRPRAVGHIGVEITETVAMQDVDRTLDALSLLRELGIVIALDDFGTGYSSLSHLKRFPIDMIKIDGSCVAGVPSDQHDVALVETLLSVAQQFKFRTLAEGVETDAQQSWLRSRGCTYGQGFSIARPMLFADFQRWIRDVRLAER